MKNTKYQFKKLKSIIKKYGEKVIVKLSLLLIEVIISNTSSQTYFKDSYQASNTIKSSINEMPVSIYSLKDVVVDGLLKIITFLTETLVSKDVIDFIIQLMNF